MWISTFYIISSFGCVVGGGVVCYVISAGASPCPTLYGKGDSQTTPICIKWEQGECLVLWLGYQYFADFFILNLLSKGNRGNCGFPLFPFATPFPHRFYARLVIFYAAKTNSRLSLRHVFVNCRRAAKEKE